MIITDIISKKYCNKPENKIGIYLTLALSSHPTRSSAATKAWD